MSAKGKPAGAESPQSAKACGGHGRYTACNFRFRACCRAISLRSIFSGGLSAGRLRWISTWYGLSSCGVASTLRSICWASSTDTTAQPKNGLGRPARLSVAILAISTSGTRSSVSTERLSFSIFSRKSLNGMFCLAALFASPLEEMYRPSESTGASSSI